MGRITILTILLVLIISACDDIIHDAAEERQYTGDPGILIVAIENITVDTTSKSADFSFTTDAESLCKVYYKIGNSITPFKPASMTTSDGLKHYTTIEDLDEGEEYTYYVVANTINPQWLNKETLHQSFRTKRVVYDYDGCRALVKGVEFASENILKFNVTELKNGNIVIAYANEINGKFKIYNPEGNLVREETIFEKNYINLETLTIIENGNFLIGYSYINSKQGAFCIYNQNGILIKAPTIFAKTNPHYFSSLALTGNRFAINFNDKDNKGVISIYNESGDSILSKNTFIESEVDRSYSTMLDNDNFIICFRDKGDFWKGKFCILDNKGKNIISQKTFENGFFSFGSIDKLDNGNWIVSYVISDKVNQDESITKYAIFDNDGNTVVAPKKIHEASYWTSVRKIKEKNHFILNYIDYNSNFGYFTLFDIDGNNIISPVQYYNKKIKYMKMSTLSDCNFVISYSDEKGNSKFDIWQPYEVYEQ